MGRVFYILRCAIRAWAVFMRMCVHACTDLGVHMHVYGVMEAAV